MKIFFLSLTIIFISGCAANFSDRDIELIEKSRSIEDFENYKILMDKVADPDHELLDAVK